MDTNFTNFLAGYIWCEMDQSDVIQQPVSVIAGWIEDATAEWAELEKEDE